MFARWPIRNKLLLSVTLLTAVVVALSAGTLYGWYAYRGLVKSLGRLTELRLVNDLVRRVNELRLTACDVGRLRPEHPPLSLNPAPDDEAFELRHHDLRQQLAEVRDVLSRYRAQLEHTEEGDLPLGGSQRELASLRAIETSLRRAERACRRFDWFDTTRAITLRNESEKLQELVGQLPGELRRNILRCTEDLQSVYRSFLVLAYATLALTVATLVLLVRLAYRSVFHPLRVLAAESGIVAGGNFQHRIELASNDEMAELAAAMNETTARFVAERDRLDRQVQEGTRQVVESERLASAGFLAAGVSHEINNPLAAIAMSAESLERRLIDAPIAEIEADMRDYLRMIEHEAKRCQNITEKLLDFSGLGESRREPTHLAQVIGDVKNVVGQLGKYRGKRIEVDAPSDVVAEVNPHEIQQVVLNLVTNALESIPADGVVRIRLRKRDGQAEITVRDNGGGMTDEVLQHLFEPFFTRRPNGQGTGLGLAITHRIVTDHGGQIEAASDGAGQGAEFRVRLPLDNEPPVAPAVAA